MNWKLPLISLVAIIVGGAWYFHNAEKLEPTNSASHSVALPLPPQVAQEGASEESDGPAPLPAGATPPKVAVPDNLDNSDAAVQKALSDLAPQITQWLMPEAQIRKWVMLVDQVADGAVQREYRPLNYPMPPFQIRHGGDKLLLDPSNYQRATLLINVVTAIPPARLAPYYRTWYPRLNEAYRELGRGGGFDKRLHLAIDRILAAQPLTGTPELIRPSVYYKYADSEYENASDLQKFLWRIGPDNTLRLQKYLRSFEQAL
ncbi:MAG: hypothetical protein JWM78_1850 [Verrucomicrobiaceae bacterium]|nr:hypothetical protein [Verrucomicrobiaceae bacterium]